MCDNLDVKSRTYFILLGCLQNTFGLDVVSWLSGAAACPAVPYLTSVPVLLVHRGIRRTVISISSLIDVVVEGFEGDIIFKKSLLKL